MSKPPIDLYWWTPTRSVVTLGSELRHHAPAWARLAVQHRRTLSNYGDVLNRILVEAVTGRTVRWREVDAAQLIAVGSVLVPYLLRGGTGQVWGSGLSKPEGFPTPEPEAGSRFLSVRGPMTRDALGLPGSTSLGDPGLIAASAIGTRAPRAGGVIVIPHFTVYNSRAGARKLSALRASGYRIVPPTVTPQQMLDEIASADAVFSSGLHGVILAHGMGKGATLIRFDDTHLGEIPFKYRDYYASVGILSPRVHLWHELLEDEPASAIAESARDEAESAAQLIEQRRADIWSAAERIS